MKRAIKRKLRQKKIFHRRYLAITCLLLSLAAVAYLGYTAVAPHSLQTGQLSDTPGYSGESPHRSLDLSLASKVTYPSSALNTIEELGVSSGVKQQIVSFSVPIDGLKEYGLLMMPSSPPPANGYPVIILCHGYINPAEYLTTEGYLTDMEFYASHGFVVVKPDFRGQGLSAGQGITQSAYYSMAYNTDVMSLISALKNTSYINKNDINLWGHSMGAYIALRASVLSRDIKTTIILSGPVGSLKQMYLSYIPPSDENNSQALKDRAAVFAKYGTPGEDTAFWKNSSPTNYLDQTSTTYQIHVGLQDPVVPPELSADFDSDLNSLKRSHGYYTYPDGRHSLLPQRQLIWARSLQALQKIK